jgi:hypothetical protein
LFVARRHPTRASSIGYSPARKRISTFPSIQNPPGEYVFTQRPGGTQVRFTYRDANPKAGSAYYYVRVFQLDPENPVGDPEIAWASPFYVTYE